MLRRRPLVAVAFLLPALTIYAGLILYPLVRGAILTFTDNTGGPTSTFVGLTQYRKLLHDPDVGAALNHTLIYAVTVVVIQTAIGLALAAILSRRARIRRFASTVLLLPALMSPVMASFIWAYLYEPEGGINTLLGKIGLNHLQQIWLGNPSIALFSIAAVNIWMYAGYSCVIFLTGYTGIPQDMLDSAEIDGASAWQRFRRIEWPMLAPALTVNVTLSLIGSLRVFEYPLVLTNGGPANSTQTLTLLVYRDIFGSSNFAYGTVVALLLLVIVVIAASVTSSLLRRRERVL